MALSGRWRGVFVLRPAPRRCESGNLRRRAARPDRHAGWVVDLGRRELSGCCSFAARLLRSLPTFWGESLSTHNIGGVLQVTGRYARGRFESLDQIADWSLFGDRWGERRFFANPQIDEGTIASLRLDVQLDTRDHAPAPNRGWLINGLAERSGGFLEGDHTFKRYLIDLRRYQPTGRGARFDLRLLGATAKGELPAQYR